MGISPVIIIDTREQIPWEFRDLPTEPGTLDTGDYSVSGLEHLIAVERKSLDDLWPASGASVTGSNASCNGSGPTGFVS